MQNEKELRRLKEQVKENNPDVEGLQKDISNLGKELSEESKTLIGLKDDTEQCQFRHEKKLKDLEKMLKEGASKEDADNEKREAILKVLLGQSEKLDCLKAASLAMKEAQAAVADTMDRRRQLFSLAAEDEEAAEKELQELEGKLSDLNSLLLEDSGQLSEMRDHLPTADPLEMLGRVERVEQDLTRGSRTLHQLQQETAGLRERQEALLRSGLEAQQQGEDAEKTARENSESLERLKGETSSASSRQPDLENELRRSSDDTDDEEKARRLAELEELMKQKDDLAAIERSLDETTEKMEEWKEFAWTEAEEQELQKYGNISSLANPSFPLHLIKDPALLALIMRRREELLEQRKKLEWWARRLEEICVAIEAMERRQREAELRRLAKQNLEWIKDFRPEGAAEFGSMPSFR
jgi:hypothetical protein